MYEDVLNKILKELTKMNRRLENIEEVLNQHIEEVEEEEKEEFQTL